MRSLDARPLARDPAAIVRELEHLDEAERRLFRRQFSKRLSDLAQVEMYWSPSTRRIVARTTEASRRFALPADAILIGAYSHPFNALEFLGDLEDVLAKIAATPAPARAG